MFLNLFSSWTVIRQWVLMLSPQDLSISSASMATLLVRFIISSIFPDCLKAAIVTPVLKSSKNFTLSNFRPISVLPVFSKLLERVVSDQIVDHFHKYNLFSQKQSGFRHGYSTQDVLLHVVNSCSKAIDCGQYTGAVFLDLAKAFLVLTMLFY